MPPGSKKMSFNNHIEPYAIPKTKKANRSVFPSQVGAYPICIIIILNTDELFLLFVVFINVHIYKHLDKPANTCQY